MAETEIAMALVGKPSVSVAMAPIDDVYDACSICLEPFERGDPATDSSYSDDSYFEECMLPNIFATGNRDDYVARREMLRSSVHGSPEFMFSRGSSVFSNDFVNESLPNGSPTPNMPYSPNNQPYNVSFASYPGNSANMTPSGCCFILLSMFGMFYCPTPRASQGKGSPSEVPSFSKSLKSKFSAASSRCKESIAKGTQGLKEKLLLNNSMKELSKEVQGLKEKLLLNNSMKEPSKEVHREMNASIAGVACIFDRLDIKRARPSVSESDYSASTSKGNTLYCDESASSQCKIDVTHESLRDANTFSSAEVSDILETQGGH